MKLFLGLDDFLIDFGFEPIAHRIQRLTGKITNFSLSRAFSMVNSLILIAEVAVSPSFSLWNKSIISFLLILFSLAYLLYIRMIEKTHKEGMVSRARLEQRGPRIFWLMWFLFITLPLEILAPSDEFIGALILAFWSTYLVSLYFLACTPLPPKKSLLKVWYERGLTALNDLLAPAPIPIPSGTRRSST